MNRKLAGKELSTVAKKLVEDTPEIIDVARQRVMENQRTPGRNPRFPWLYDGLYDDIDRARQLFDGPRSSEEEARIATRSVLNAISELLSTLKFYGEGDFLGADLGLFLRDLGSLFHDPRSVGFLLPATGGVSSPHIRKVVFAYVTQGTERKQAARLRNLAVARRVRELRKAKRKGANGIAAKEFRMTAETVSRICNNPDVKKALDLEDSIRSLKTS